MFTIVGGYSLWQAIIMFKLEEFTIFARVQHNHFRAKDAFGGEQNMTFAFGIESLNEDYGKMRAYYQDWSTEINDNQFTEIRTRNCSNDDFGFTLNKTDKHKRFFNPQDQESIELKRIMPSLRCFDEALSVNGDWDSPTAKILLMVFEKCDKSKPNTCRTD